MQASKLVAERTSLYGRYEVVDTVYNGRPGRVLYTEQRTSAQSGIATDGDTTMLFDYNQRFVELIRGRRPQKILVLGGGAFTLPTAILNAIPDQRLDIVELDGQLLDIAQQFFDFQEGSRTIVYVMDALKFLENSRTRYDMIIIDIFTHTTIPAPFQGVEFMQLLASHLLANGMITMNVIASYHGERSAALCRIIDASKKVFNDLQLFPAGHEPSLWLPQNFIVCAGMAPGNAATFLRYQQLALPIT